MASSRIINARGLVNASVNFATKHGVGYMTVEKASNDKPNYGIFAEIESQFELWAAKKVKVVIHSSTALGDEDTLAPQPYIREKEKKFYSKLLESENMPVVFRDPQNYGKRLEKSQEDIVNNCFNGKIQDIVASLQATNDDWAKRVAKNLETTYSS